MNTAGIIHDSFQSFYSNATSRLAELTNVPDQESLDHLSGTITNQQRVLNEAAGALPAFDIRSYQGKIDQISMAVSSLKEKQAPKSRFSFRSKKDTALKDNVPGEAQVTKPQAISPLVAVKDDAVMLQTPGSLTITQDHQVQGNIDIGAFPAILNSSALTVHSVSDRVINLTRTKPYTSVTLRDISSCTIFAGICTSSIFIDNCSSCKIQGSAQQFRIHDSKACEIRYICLTGRPIIEDCHDMKFFNEAKDVHGAALDTVVDDFSDLSGSRRNWSVLDPSAHEVK